MFEYASWGIFILSFLLSYSLLTRAFLSREEKNFLSSFLGKAKKADSKRTNIKKKKSKKNDVKNNKRNISLKIV